MSNCIKPLLPLQEMSIKLKIQLGFPAENVQNHLEKPVEDTLYEPIPCIQYPPTFGKSKITAEYPAPPLICSLGWQTRTRFEVRTQERRGSERVCE